MRNQREDTPPKAPKAPKEKPEKTKLTLKTGRPLPDAPSYLGAHGKTCWKRTVEVLGMMGVADLADLRSVEALCSAYDEYRDARAAVDEHGMTYETFNQSGELVVKKRPEVDIASNAWQRMRSLLPELCMTPLARFRAAPPKDGKVDKDPFAEFLEN